MAKTNESSGESLTLYIHSPGSLEPDELAVPRTVRVDELLVGLDGEFVFIEEEETPLEPGKTLTEVGLVSGRNLFRGPCREVDVVVTAKGREAARRFAPSIRAGTVAHWAAESLDLGLTADVLIVDRRNGRQVEPSIHIGSLVERGDCSVSLGLEDRQSDVEIIVNTRPKVVPAGEISFDTVVKLAFPTPPPGQLIEYDVTYRHGPPEHPRGSLLEGQSVCVRNGMIFNVSATDKS